MNLPDDAASRSRRLIEVLLPDLDQRIVKFSVLTDRADADLQQFFHDHVSSVLPSIRAALDCNDLAEARRQAHGLKGAGGSVGYPEISALAERIEEVSRNGDAQEARRLVAGLQRWLSEVTENVS